MIRAVAITAQALKWSFSETGAIASKIDSLSAELF